jgi:hypothetical protein
MQLAPERTVIERLLLRGSRDPALDRLRIEAVLGAMDVGLSEFPRHAVLVVRYLHAPALGSLRGPSDMVGLRAAEAALRSRLSALARQAARPAHGPVPANADAVLFRDPAEWLACLVLDVVGGRFGDAWWWSALRRRSTAREAVASAWRASPEHVPDAVRLLAQAGASAQLSSFMRGRAARVLLTAVADVHALAILHERLRAEPRLASPTPRSLEETAPGPLGAGPHAPPSKAATAHGAAHPDPSLAPGASEPPAFMAAHSELPVDDPEARALVAVALTLARAPARARSSAFQRGVAAALEREPEGADKPVARAQPTATEAEPDERRAALSPSPRQPPTDRPRLRWLSNAMPPTPSSPPPLARSPEAEAELDRSNDGSRPLASRQAQEHRHVNAAGSAAASPTPAPAQRAEAEAVPARARPELAKAEPLAAPAAELDEHAFATRIGGLFFLLGVGMRLGLYADFSTPREPGIALPPGDYLELLGRALLGGSHPDDPLWSYLEQLASRHPGEPPGAGFVPPRVWSLPHAWLAPFDPPRAIECRREAGRLLALHPAGFILLDAPDRGEPVSQLQAELPAGCRDARVTWGAPAACVELTPLERWTHCLAVYVRARLALALGCPGADVAALALERPARVRSTPTHVEVLMSLDDHPIELRRAGLDRDLGWVPAMSRYLVFRFEGGEA